MATALCHDERALEVNKTRKQPGVTSIDSKRRSLVSFVTCQTQASPVVASHQSTPHQTATDDTTAAIAQDAGPTLLSYGIL